MAARLAKAEVRDNPDADPLPFAGEEGPKRSLGGEGLCRRLSKTLTLPSPAESGRGVIRFKGQALRRRPCSSTARAYDRRDRRNLDPRPPEDLSGRQARAR